MNNKFLLRGFHQTQSNTNKSQTSSQDVLTSSTNGELQDPEKKRRLSSDEDMKNEGSNKRKKDVADKPVHHKENKEGDKNSARVTRSKSKLNETAKDDTKEEDEKEEKLNLINFIYLLELLQVAALEENSDIKFSDAIKNKHWKKSIGKEINGFFKNGVIKKIFNDEGQKFIEKQQILDTKWILKIKKDHLNNKVLKSRMVIRGFLEQYLSTTKEGIKEEKLRNYAPTSSRAQLRLLIILLIIDGEFEMLIYDVSQAFIHANLRENKYIRFKDQNNNKKIALITKSIYGLRESASNWFKLLSKNIEDYGFESSPLGPTLFVKWNKEKDSSAKNNKIDAMILIFVDDIAIIGRNVDEVACYLSTKFKGKVVTSKFEKKFKLLGLQFERQLKGSITKEIQISNTDYIDKIVKIAKADDKLQSLGGNMKRQISTPQMPGISQPNDSLNIKNTTQNLKLIQKYLGKLVYLSVSGRLDILFGTVNIARHQIPNYEIYRNLVHMFQYIDRTKHYKLEFSRKNFIQNHLNINVLVDASKNNSQSKQSAIGFITFISNIGVLNYRSDVTNNVTLSTCESECHAILNGLLDATYYQNLLKDLFKIKTTIQIYSDSTSAINFIKSSNITNQNKNFDIKLFHLRKRLKNNEFNINHIPGKMNKADIMTKNTDTKTFYSHVSNIFK